MLSIMIWWLCRPGALGLGRMLGSQHRVVCRLPPCIATSEGLTPVPLAGTCTILHVALPGTGLVGSHASRMWAVKESWCIVRALEAQCERAGVSIWPPTVDMLLSSI